VISTSLGAVIAAIFGAFDRHAVDHADDQPAVF